MQNRRNHPSFIYVCHGLRIGLGKQKLKNPALLPSEHPDQKLLNASEHQLLDRRHIPHEQEQHRSWLAGKRWWCCIVAEEAAAVVVAIAAALSNSSK